MKLETLLQSNISEELKNIATKVYQEERITIEDGILLFEKADLNFLGSLSNYIREKKHGDITYFNKNFHIEPTNICVFDCKFCAYSMLLRNKGDYDAWEMTEEDIYKTIRSYNDKEVTEVHIVGGVHPKMGLQYFANLIKNIKKIRPELHVKAFTAVELEYMCRKAKVSYQEGLQILKDHGQDSLPGGGAEIFAESVREEICKDKCSSAEWLEIHETAHKIGMPSNATMLYGHVESYADRVDHMNRLRSLQDKTGGFNTFIPLKFRNGNNQMSHIKEVSVLEDLRTYAIARIFMDNFPHLKAYWPMIGRETAQLSLNYGVNDIDGTIDDTTKIYSMAGAEEQSPNMTTSQIIDLIKKVNRKPVERDSVYNVVNDYSETVPETA
ncbi:MAG: aminofutalosine synthase MqnE [Flavobacteriales bacterium]|nr:aminofutalosine synthase MqnE [Flavobacteriales bacterium]